MMSLLRLLNVQGIGGIAASLALGLLLIIQKGETRHWKKQSSHLEQLHAETQAVLTETIAKYSAAANAARAADQANLARVTAEQRAINERTSNDYQARLAAAHALAQRLRTESASAAADRGDRGNPAVSSLPAPPGGAFEDPREDGFLGADRELATEQAIQLDELIKWVKAQSEVDPNAPRK